jgi:hypothetical protein
MADSESVTIEEPQPAPTQEHTPEHFGVDQASFDKYYKEGNFNWEGYGKEQAYKQAQGKSSEPTQVDQSPPEDAQAAVNQAGLNWGSLETKVQSDGDIAPEDYAALESIGVPPEIVKNYIEMVQSSSESIINDVVQRFGGQEQFETAYAALVQNVPLDQRNKIDDLLRDPFTRDQGVALAQSLVGQSPVSAPAPAPAPTPVPSRGNSASAAPTAVGFASLSEQAAAQADPRYRSDPAYREEVVRRIVASTYDMNPRSHTAGL